MSVNGCRVAFVGDDKPIIIYFIVESVGCLPFLLSSSIARDVL